MRYLLDTDTCVFVLRGDRAVERRLRAVRSADVAVSVITLAELWFGALLSREPERSRARADLLTDPLLVLELDRAAAEPHAVVRQYLRLAGTPIGDRDLLIAASGLAYGLTVVTHNTREFRRVPGLGVEDWSA